MTRVARITVSLPAETLRGLDRESRRRQLSRSASVKQAVEAWLAAGEVSEAEQAYVDGYLRTPETSVAELAASVMATWEPWE